MPNDDEALWMKMALAALAQGNGFLSALDAADRTIARLWLTRAEAGRPGVVKCGSSSRSAMPPAPTALEQAANG